MRSDNRVLGPMGIIRVLGLVVIFLVAFGSTPSDTTALSGCTTYTMEECVEESFCFSEAENECGDELPGCSGAGWVACGWSNCDPGEVTMVCQFEEPE